MSALSRSASSRRSQQDLVSEPQVTVGGADEVGEVGRVGQPGGVERALLGQPLRPVLAQRLEHPEPGLAAVAAGDQQGLVDEGVQHVLDRRPFTAGTGQTAATASAVAPEPKTEKCSATSRSSGVSRSQLHSTTARRVR